MFKCSRQLKRWYSFCLSPYPCLLLSCVSSSGPQMTVAFETVDEPMPRRRHRSVRNWSARRHKQLGGLMAADMMSSLHPRRCSNSSRWSRHSLYPCRSLVDAGCRDVRYSALLECRSWTLPCLHDNHIVLVMINGIICCFISKLPVRPE